MQAPTTLVNESWGGSQLHFETMRPQADGLHFELEMIGREAPSFILISMMYASNRFELIDRFRVDRLDW